MADVVSPQKRSEMMSGIRGKDTKPELLIRKALHAEGYRFRLHDKKLPGKPDLMLPKYRAAIFVHGCFWHGHDCHLFKWPKSRTEFWRSKIFKNQDNDEKALNSLESSDWRVLVIWECALKGKERLNFEEVIDELTGWLHSDDVFYEIRGRNRVDDENRLYGNTKSRQAERDHGCKRSHTSVRQKTCS